MDADILYRIAALVGGLVLAWGLMNAATWRQQKAARARREAVTRAHPDYWNRPARRRKRSRTI